MLLLVVVSTLFIFPVAKSSLISQCLDISYGESWQQGVKGEIDITFPKNVKKWKLEIIFDKGISDLQFYQGIVKKRNSKKFLIKNRNYNGKNKKGDTVSSGWQASYNKKYKQHPKIRKARLINMDCSNLITTPTMATTSITTTAETTVTSSTEITNNSTAPDGCVDFSHGHSWLQGQDGKMDIHFPESVSDWVVVVTFNNTVNQLSVYQGEVTRIDDKTFKVVNKNYNGIQEAGATVSSGWQALFDEKMSPVQMVSAILVGLCSDLSSTTSGSNITSTESSSTVPTYTTSGTAVTQVIGNCTVEVDYQNTWNSGSIGELNVEAEGDLFGWLMEITFTNKVRDVEFFTGNLVSFNGNKVQISNKSYNGNITSGSILILGWKILFEQESLEPSIESVSLDGTKCLISTLLTSTTTGTSSSSSQFTSTASSSSTTSFTSSVETTTVGSSSSYSPSTTSSMISTSAGTITNSVTSQSSSISTSSSPTTGFTSSVQTSTVESSSSSSPSTTSFGSSSTTSSTLTTSNSTTTNSASTVSSCIGITKYNYDEAIFKSNLFYQAQRSGYIDTYGDFNHAMIPYRGDSALKDGSDNSIDLIGGYYDAGDYVKFNFPMAAATTILAWGAIDFAEGYKAAGQYEQTLNTIKWATDYFIKCHPEPNILYAQVGDGNADHSQWDRVEQMSISRPSYKLDAQNPGSDLAGEMAAALAAASIVFQNTDKEYSDELLQHSKDMFTFADSYRGKYSDSVPGVSSFYNSWSGFQDELAWAAAWLYKATQNDDYLQKAKQLFQDKDVGELSWDDKTIGAAILLAQLTNEQKYINRVSSFCTKMADVQQRTPQGLVWIQQWGSLRHASNAAFACLETALVMDSSSDIAKFRQFALSQIHYALGDTGRSFIVGFGVNPPTRPHHRSSSCPVDPSVSCGWNDFNQPGPNPSILWGALVGGPASDDSYEDKRDDYIKNEVTTDYNAGFQSALAGLRSLAKDGELPGLNGSC